MGDGVDAEPNMPPTAAVAVAGIYRGLDAGHDAVAVDDAAGDELGGARRDNSERRSAF